MSDAPAPSRVVLINDASVARGGATGLALAAARALRARGVAVTFICGDAGANDELARIGVEVVALGADRLLARGRLDALRSGIRNRAAREMVARFLSARDDGRSVYHVHGWAQILSPALFEALAPVAARTVIHAHDMFLACPNGVYMNYPRGRVCALRPMSAACIASHCDKRSRLHKVWRLLRQRALIGALNWPGEWGAVVPIHPAMVERLARGGVPERLCRVIRNPAAPFTAERIRAEDNRELVYVGRLETDKGVLDLARAAARCGVGLRLVGDGSLRARLAAEFPAFPVTGWLDRAAIGRVVARARALVMPSHHPEPFALVIAEASLSGLPVLVSDTALMAEEVRSAGLGLSFDVFDPASLDAALRHIRDMAPEEVRAISRRGHGRVVRLALDEAEWTDALMALYREVLAAAGAPRASGPGSAVASPG